MVVTLTGSSAVPAPSIATPSPGAEAPLAVPSEVTPGDDGPPLIPSGPDPESLEGAVAGAPRAEGSEFVARHGRSQCQGEGQDKRALGKGGARVRKEILSSGQGLLYHRTCKPDFLCSWPSINSYLE